jgi:hypothetical protein
LYYDLNRLAQQERLEKIESLTQEYADLSELHSLLSASPSGEKKINLQAHADLIDRISERSPNLLSHDNYTWKSENIEGQLGSIKNKIAFIPTELNAQYSDVSLKERDIQDVREIVEKILKTESEAANHMVKNQC